MFRQCIAGASAAASLRSVGGACWSTGQTVSSHEPSTLEQAQRHETLGAVLRRLQSAPQGSSAVRAIISSSTSIFENLAIEEALMRAADLTPLPSAPAAPLRDGGPRQLVPLQLLMFSYIDEPSVVIGRNQCVFTEVNVLRCRDHGVDIARRHSGGGTVFHDRGNINFTFITHRQSYDPTRTIGVLMKFLVDHFQIDASRLTTTKRHDIFLDGKKISGSAMRLQRDAAYHHCTLLVSSDRAALKGCLGSSGRYTAVATHATSSVRSPVTTLLEHVHVGPSCSTASKDDGDASTTGCEMRAAACHVQRAFLSYACRHGVSVFAASALGDTIQTLADGAETVEHRNVVWHGLAASGSDSQVDGGDDSPDSTTLVAPHTPTSSLHDVAFLDAPNRKAPLRGPMTIGDEVATLQDPMWVYGSMPPLTTTVRITMDALCNAVAAPLGAHAATNHRAVALFMASMHSCYFVQHEDDVPKPQPRAQADGIALLCRVTIERAVVKSVEWRVTHAHEEGNETGPWQAGGVWLNAYLSPLLVGSRICATHSSIMDALGDQLQPTCSVWEEILFGCAQDSNAMDAVQQLKVDLDGCQACTHDDANASVATTASNTMVVRLLIGLVSTWCDQNGWW